MRERTEFWTILLAAAFAFSGAVAWKMMHASPDVLIEPIVVDPSVQPRHHEPVAVGPLAEAQQWFEQARGFCNPVDVETRMRWQPSPKTEEGVTYRAACFALAGKIDRAREAIESLPPSNRYHAAGVVFAVGHPAADAGDELAAGPLMELVVEYWPNHYMALYHAGAAAFQRGDLAPAADYLQRFLDTYTQQDGWTESARKMLAAIPSLGC